MSVVEGAEEREEEAIGSGDVDVGGPISEEG